MPTVSTTFDFDRIAFHTIESEYNNTHLPGAMTTETAYKGSEVAGRAVTHFATVAYGPDDGDKSFHGLTVFTGTILGKTGTVALTLSGTIAHGATVVETAGELKGIKGTGRSVGAPGQQEGIEATFEVEFA